MNEFTCFGPFGKTKVVTNASGSIILSKDGHSHLSGAIGSHPVCSRTVVERVLTSSAFRRGDGLLASILLSRCLISFIDSKDDCCQDNYPDRVRYISSLTAVQNVCCIFQSMIVKSFIESGWWIRENSLLLKIRSFCLSTALPASSPGVARSVWEILEEWIFLQIAESRINSIKLHALCNYILKHFQTLVKISIGSFQQNSMKFYQIIPCDRILISGKCRDYTALSNPSPTKIVFMRNLSGNDRGKGEYSLVLPSSETYLNSAESSNLIISTLAKYLRLSCGKNERMVIVTTTQCSDTDIAIFLAEKSLYLMEGISEEALAYAAERVNCVVYEDPEQLLPFLVNAAPASDSSSSTSSSSCIISFGVMSHLERVLFGSQNELTYILCGVVGIDTAAASTENHCLINTPIPPVSVAQLVISGTSTLSTGIYIKLMQRCLRVLAFSAASSDQVNDTPGETQQHTKSTEDEMQASWLWEVVVPGGGAGEMAWSCLWKEVAAVLRESQQLGIDKQTIISNILSGQNSLMGRDKYPDSIVFLIRVLTRAIYEKLSCYDSSYVLAGANFCDNLSAAYMNVPQQLLHSCVDVIHLHLPHSRSEERQKLHYWQEKCIGRPEDVTGRLGVIMNSDTSSWKVCSLEDAGLSSVYCSYFQFWSVFNDILETTKIHLRVGGDAGLLLVKGRLRPPYDEDRHDDD